MRLSVLLSTAEVASSIMSTFERLSKALARHTNCLSPTLNVSIQFKGVVVGYSHLKFDPFSAISCSSFFSKSFHRGRKIHELSQKSKIMQPSCTVPSKWACFIAAQS